MKRGLVLLTLLTCSAGPSDFNPIMPVEADDPCVQGEVSACLRRSDSLHRSWARSVIASQAGSGSARPAHHRQAAQALQIACDQGNSDACWVTKGDAEACRQGRDASCDLLPEDYGGPLVSAWNDRCHAGEPAACERLREFGWRSKRVRDVVQGTWEAEPTVLGSLDWTPAGAAVAVLENPMHKRAIVSFSQQEKKIYPILSPEDEHRLSQVIVMGDRGILVLEDPPTWPVVQIALDWRGQQRPVRFLEVTDEAVRLVEARHPDWSLFSDRLKRLPDTEYALAFAAECPGCEARDLAWIDLSSGEVTPVEVPSIEGRPILSVMNVAPGWLAIRAKNEEGQEQIHRSRVDGRHQPPRLKGFEAVDLPNSRGVRVTSRGEVIVLTDQGPVLSSGGPLQRALASGPLAVHASGKLFASMQMNPLSRIQLLDHRGRVLEELIPGGFWSLDSFSPNGDLLLNMGGPTWVRLSDAPDPPDPPLPSWLSSLEEELNIPPLSYDLPPAADGVGEVRGSVQLGEAPLVGVVVTLQATSEGTVSWPKEQIEAHSNFLRQQTVTDTQGRFAFSGLPQGEVKVFTEAAGQWIAPCELTVLEGKTGECALVQGVGEAVTTTVVDAAGEPVDGVTVWVITHEEQVQALSSETGVYQSMISPDWNPVLAYAIHPDGRVGRAPIVSSISQSPQRHTARIQLAPPVQITVIDGAGEPVPDVEIWRQHVHRHGSGPYGTKKVGQTDTLGQWTPEPMDLLGADGTLLVQDELRLPYPVPLGEEVQPTWNFPERLLVALPDEDGEFHFRDSGREFWVQRSEEDRIVHRSDVLQELPEVAPGKLEMKFRAEDRIWIAELDLPAQQNPAHPEWREIERSQTRLVDSQGVALPGIQVEWIEEELTAISDKAGVLELPIPVGEAIAARFTQGGQVHVQVLQQPLAEHVVVPTPAERNARALALGSGIRVEKQEGGWRIVEVDPQGAWAEVLAVNDVMPEDPAALWRRLSPSYPVVHKRVTVSHALGRRDVILAGGRGCVDAPQDGSFSVAQQASAALCVVEEPREFATRPADWESRTLADKLEGTWVHRDLWYERTFAARALAVELAQSDRLQTEDWWRSVPSPLDRLMIQSMREQVLASLDNPARIAAFLTPREPATIQIRSEHLAKLEEVGGALFTQSRVPQGGRLVGVLVDEQTWVVHTPGLERLLGRDIHVGGNQVWVRPDAQE